MKNKITELKRQISLRVWRVNCAWVELKRAAGLLPLTCTIISLAALTARAQDWSYISADLVATNTFVTANTNANTLGFTNLVSANYDVSQNWAYTAGLGTLSTPSTFENFELLSAQFVGTNGTTLTAPTLGTNYLAVQYGLYMNDAARQFPALTNIPGTTTPLPVVTIPIYPQTLPATNYWTFTTNNGTIQTNKLFYAGYQVSGGTIAASNFYGAKYYKVVGLAWVATNNVPNAQLSIFHLYSGHWVQGLSTH